MNGKTVFFALAAGACCLAAFGSQVVELTTWRFSENGGVWQEVRVPHDWAITGPFDRTNDIQEVAVRENGERTADVKSGRTGALPWIGRGKYRTTVEIPSGTGYAALLFDGAMSEPEVFCDGVKVGEWKNGYNGFEVPLPTEAGKHDIAVRVRTRPQSSRWYPGAGLFRPVRLVTGHATGVKTWGTSLWTPDLRTVCVTTECRGEPGRIVYSVSDGEMEARREGVGERWKAELKGDFIPWSPENPKLYTLVTEVYGRDGKLCDRTETRFGVRTLEYGHGFFALNGEKRKFRGVCLHHDLGPLGAAFDADAYRRQVTLLKEMGCDAIRTAHNMPGEDQLAVCDELGMMVMAESFDSWAYPKMDNGYSLFFAAWWRQDIENLVKKCRNHPSVVMWSIGNEVYEQRYPETAALAREMQLHVHRFDPDPARKVTQGLSQFPEAIASGVHRVMEIPGVTYRLPWYDRMLADTESGLVLGAETASTVSSRGEYFFPVREGTGILHKNGQCSSYDVEYCAWSNLPDDDWQVQDSRPWTIGEFVWTGFDYLGEPTPYDAYWPSRSSYFGIFDLAGIPKDRYWLYRSRWNRREPTLHVLPHWTWPGREGQVTPVYVYTSYPSAELFVNGRSMGRRAFDSSSRLDRYRLRWNEVVYEPGELKVVAYDSAGRAVRTEVVRTAGKPASVRVDRRRFGNLLFAEATVVDEKGVPVPDADCKLKVKTGGGLRFRAICNGDATSLEPFHLPHMRAFHGKLVVICEGPGEDVRIDMEKED